MSDRIHIKDLLLRAIIGINEEERRNRQDVIINITLEADLRAAGNSDNIADAVNYRTLTKRVISLVEGSQFYLVEKMAAEIAALCLADEQVEAATVAVEKPGALRFARSVGVEIHRSRADMKKAHRVFIALGANMEPERNLREAVRRLAARCQVVALSPVYETQPVGKVDQPNFLNAAALIETDLSAADLKAQVLAAIEQELGRVRTADKNAPRTIDLDIALYDDEIIDVGHRQIPDPDILKYPHIALPLADLAPNALHPETGQTLTEIARGLDAGGIVRRVDIAL